MLKFREISGFFSGDPPFMSHHCVIVLCYWRLNWWWWCWWNLADGKLVTSCVAYHTRHVGRWKGQKMPFLSLVTLTFNFDQRGTKHVFRVNLAQMCSAVPPMDSWHTCAN